MLCIGETSAQVANEMVELRVGHPMPIFELKDVRYFSKKQVNLQDFKGEWLILDFWSEYCSSCMSSMPKYNEYQKEFKKDLRFVLIADINRNRSIPQSQILKSTEGKYETLRKRHNLNLTVAYDQSGLYTKYARDGGQPFVVVIDPRGIIRAVTSGVKREDIVSFLADKNPVIEPYKYGRSFDSSEVALMEGFDFNKPLLSTGNGEKFSTVAYRSLITNHHPDVRTVGFYTTGGQFEAVGYYLNQLYELAYWGTDQFKDGRFGLTYPKLIFEVKDSTKFVSADYSNLKKVTRFSYSLIMQTDSLDDVVKYKFENNKKAQKIMQNDLKNYFGYIGIIDTREMACLKLVCDERMIHKIKSKAAAKIVESLYKGEGGSIQNGMILKNAPVEYLIAYAKGANGYRDVIIDETGFSGNIDIKIDALSNDWKGVCEELAKYGFKFIPGKKAMKVLAIRDAPVDQGSIK